MPEDLLVTRPNGNKLVVEIIAQHMDFRNADAIKAAVASLVQQSSKDIVMNLHNVTFMDSAGLSVILFCKRTCEEAKGSFSLCQLQDYVTNLVNLTNLNKSIPIYATDAEAV